MEQAAGNGEFLLHAARELGGQCLSLVGDLQLVEQWRDPLLRVGDAVQSSDEAKMLLDGEVIEEMRLVRNEGERLLGRNRVLLNVVTGNLDRACGRRNDAGQASQGGGLASAIRTNEAEHFSGVDGERDAVHRGEVAVISAERADVDHELSELVTAGGYFTTARRVRVAECPTPRRSSRASPSSRQGSSPLRLRKPRRLA